MPLLNIMENPLHEVVTKEGALEGRQDHNVHIRTPSKVLHFCDGVIEEFSDDETESPEQVQTEVIDTKTLNWVPWIMHYMWAGGNKAIEYCDYAGEGLANFLGITTPKYQLEISEHERIEAENKQMAEDSAGWMTNDPNIDTPLVVLQPIPVISSENPAPV